MRPPSRPPVIVVVFVVIVIVLLVVFVVIVGIVRAIKTSRTVIIEGLSAIEGRLLGLNLSPLLLVCTLGLLEDGQKRLALDRQLVRASHGIDRGPSAERQVMEGGQQMQGQRDGGAKATYVLDDLAGVVDNGYRLFERHTGGVTPTVIWVEKQSETTADQQLKEEKEDDSRGVAEHKLRGDRESDGEGEPKTAEPKPLTLPGRWRAGGTSVWLVRWGAVEVSRVPRQKFELELEGTKTGLGGRRKRAGFCRSRRSSCLLSHALSKTSMREIKRRKSPTFRLSSDMQCQPSGRTLVSCRAITKEATRGHAPEPNNLTDAVRQQQGPWIDCL